jgi:uncharacterized protein YaaR (DUF327 family)
MTISRGGWHMIEMEKTSGQKHSVTVKRRKGKKSSVTDLTTVQGNFYEELSFAQTEQLHLEFEELVEEIARQGKRFAKNPTQELLKLYKSMIKDFLQYVTKHMLQVEHRTGGKMKQKIYTVTTVIDEKLKDLTVLVMSQQANNIHLLSTLDEIRGILIDLVQ